MWFDIGNYDRYKQCVSISWEPLYENEEKGIYNANLKLIDLMKTFMKFEKRWAFLQHEDSADANWFKMQDSFAEIIVSHYENEELRDIIKSSNRTLKRHIRNFD
jgi:hypothetical protein